MPTKTTFASELRTTTDGCDAGHVPLPAAEQHGKRQRYGRDADVLLREALQYFASPPRKRRGRQGKTLEEQLAEQVAIRDTSEDPLDKLRASADVKRLEAEIEDQSNVRQLGDYVWNFVRYAAGWSALNGVGYDDWRQIHPYVPAYLLKKAGITSNDAHLD